MQVKTHEWWRQQYHEDSYMAHLDEAALASRFSAVMANSCSVTDELKLGLLSSAIQSPESTNFWLIAFTHLLEEWGGRGLSPSPHMDLSSFAKLDWPGLRSAVPPFNLSRRSHDEVLVRYGKSIHLREALNTGRIRISPASLYNDSSLNAATRDNELELTVYRRSKLYTKLSDQYGMALRPAGRAYGVKTEVLKARSNYYVHCLCTLRSLRMFGDFQADAAVVFHDTKRFIRGLGETVREHLGAGWKWVARPVRYIDPLRPPASALDLFECKHFLYTYQHEYRLIWFPAKPVEYLEPFFINTEPLSNYAQYIELTA